MVKYYKKYGEPKKKYANLILNGKEKVEENVKKILKMLQSS